MEAVGLKLLLQPLGSGIVFRTACCAVGIGLPVYSTYKAIERKDQDEQEKWLLYWAVYGTFGLVEMCAEKILSGIPFYYHVKFAFLVWLQLPSNNGSAYLYERYMQPFFKKYEVKIDRVLRVLSNEIAKLISNHQGEINLAKSAALKLTSTANHIWNEDDEQSTQPAHANLVEGRRLPAQLEPHSDSEPEN